MLGGIAPLDVVELLFLVDIDQDVALDGLEKAGPLDLSRLKDNIAIRQNHDCPYLSARVDHIKRIRKEPVRKRIVDQICRDCQQVRFVRISHAVSLQGSQIIGVTKFLRSSSNIRQ